VLVLMAGDGLTHGDLSAYNLLVHDGRLVVIDLPQVVDVVSNPRGLEFLERDVRVITGWFASRGLPPEVADPAALVALLRAEAGLP
jgi:RIO kinase 1